MSLTSRFVASQAPLGRWTAGATALGVVAAGVLLAPDPSAAVGFADQPRVSARSAPASAHALIRMIPLGEKGLAVGVGGGVTASAADDTIYLSSNNARVTVIDPVSLEAVGTFTVGNYPIGVAVGRDDTVYVVNANSDTLSVIDPVSATVRSVSVPDAPQAVAVSRASDDTVFVSTSGTSRTITTLKADNLDDSARTSLGSNGASPWGLAVGSDDTAYIASYSASKIFRFNATTRVLSDAFTSAEGPIGVALSSDDSVYFTRETGNALTRFSTADPSSFLSLAVGRPQGVAVGPDGRAYVAGQVSGDGIITIVNPLDLSLDDTIATGPGAWSSIAVTRAGLAVAVDRNYHNYAVVIADVAPALVTTSAFAGARGSLTLGGLPAGVTVDDTTVSSVAFGDDTVVWTRTAGTNTFTGPIPPGSGSVPVVVALNGGNSASAGTFTYASTPPAPRPSGPPVDVQAVAGDASALVSWSAPVSSGTWAVSNYQVVSSPGGRTCLTASLSCEVDGLSNGVAYTFSVRALTGAGWSAWSVPSAAVTPVAPVRPSIVITGSRDGRSIAVSGSSTGLGMGAVLRPWFRFPGQTGYAEGSATILVSENGSFEWGRRTGKKIYVYVATPDRAVRSSAIVISAR